MAHRTVLLLLVMVNIWMQSEIAIAGESSRLQLLREIERIGKIIDGSEKEGRDATKERVKLKELQELEQECAESKAYVKVRQIAFKDGKYFPDESPAYKYYDLSKNKEYRQFEPDGIKIRGNNGYYRSQYNKRHLTDKRASELVEECEEFGEKNKSTKVWLIVVVLAVVGVGVAVVGLVVFRRIRAKKLHATEINRATEIVYAAASHDQKLADLLKDECKVEQEKKERP